MADNAEDDEQDIWERSGLETNGLETNAEFMDRIMNFCPTGALVQAFVLEALRRYAEQVADPAVNIQDTPLLSGKAWKRTGVWVLDQVEKHLTSHG